MSNRILLVDEDAAVRRMLMRVLTDDHYVVLAASEGMEALAMAASSAPDLLLLDLGSCGEREEALFERLLAVNPFLPVILIRSRPNRRSPLLARAAAVLDKPLDFPELLRGIRQALGGAEAGLSGHPKVLQAAAPGVQATGWTTVANRTS